MIHIEIIITIIISAGLLGGMTNFFLLYDSDFNSSGCWINFFKSISLSLCASITVPLFLQIISNNLLDAPINGQPFPVKNYFILVGFCILAAFYSKRFLEDLYAKVNQAENKANKAIQIAEKTELNTQENDDIDDIERKVTDFKAEKIFETEHSLDDIKKVAESIVNSKYTFRTISGISKDTGFAKEKVKYILELLRDASLAESKKNKKGNDLWKIVYND